MIECLRYGGRLKLFYYCDQGLKNDNNRLSFLRRPDMQKKMRHVKFRKTEKLRLANEEVKDDEGQPITLNSNFRKSKRWVPQNIQLFEVPDVFYVSSPRSTKMQLRCR